MSRLKPLLQVEVVDADAARHNVALGAHIIDINMGCAAKKVCHVASGSALLRDEALVGRILDAVVRAVPVPVTLKMRTGYSRATRNAVAVARIAASAGIAALAVHGRTREDHFTGQAEYASIAAVKAAVSIPVMVNGDIASAAAARTVLARTGADAVMIGRAARGRPWIFREIAHELAGGEPLPQPTTTEVRDILLAHLAALHAFYGEHMGVRIARKHLGWYSQKRGQAQAFRTSVNRADSAAQQLRLAQEYFDSLIEQPRAAA